MSDTATTYTSRPASSAYVRFGLLAVGAAMVWWSAYIHLHLYFTGFQNIPTIGRLFLAQGIAGGVTGLAVVVTRRDSACLAGAFLMIATLAGFVWTDLFGLFGFNETFSESYAGLSLVVEVAGAATLAAAALTGPRRVE